MTPHPRPPRLVGVDSETLRVWTERGVTAMSPEKAESLRASDATSGLALDALRTVSPSDDEGYVLGGPSMAGSMHVIGEKGLEKVMVGLTIHIRREDAKGRWLPVRSWVIWGDARALEWNDARWAEIGDGAYRLEIDAVPPVPFEVRDGRAYLTDGGPLRLGNG